MKALFTALSLLWLPFIAVMAQCCSPGMPSGGTTNQGVVPHHAIRVTAFYQFASGNHFYTGSQKQPYNYIEGARFHFTGFNFAYGITAKWTAEADAGYYLNRHILYSPQAAEDNPYNSAGGLSDFMLKIKYAAYKNVPGEWEITPMLGVRLPASLQPKTVNGKPLPIDLQSGTQSFGITGGVMVYKGLPNRKTRLFLNSQTLYSFENKQHYRFGVTVSNALFVSQTLNHRFTLIAQLRNEWRQPDLRNGLLRSSTGNNLLLFAPQLTCSFANWWNVSVQAEAPLYQHYNGTQLGRNWAAALVVNKLFRK
ncbi:hypothetical protein C7N43_13375 [Sphingobacteriales bacterium UPWRP_1]|nr:hypothetical protein B6N25_03510 [Sphingobacteriales bacterium TSM_CSS]PSJ76518.1 hypothetical protein C7N43_13375 [Sphingobacteriales bacterium UPWRP_1]